MPEAAVGGWLDGTTRRVIQDWQKVNTLATDAGELSPQQIARLLSLA